MEIILIAAMAANWVIGHNNRIPWHIPGEQKRFRDTTWGSTVIMGRRTYESIGRALPGRRNIVVTRNAHYQADGCETAASLRQAYELCEGEDRVFNIGGEQLYRLGIKDADVLILTVLKKPVVGDSYFPDFSEDDFVLVRYKDIEAPTPYTVKIYKRIGR